MEDEMTLMRTLGEAQLSLLYDGRMEMEGGRIFSPASEAEWSALRAPDGPGMTVTHITSLLISIGGRHTLVDTGYGEEGRPGQPGQLLASLSAVGLAPKDITRVVITHAHGDHCMGNTLRRAGQWLPTFPLAEFVMQAAEAESLKKANAEIWATRFAPLADRDKLRLIEGTTAIDDHVGGWLTVGHTVGHQAVRIDTAAGSAVYVGDLALFRENLARPEWGPDWAAVRMEDVLNRQRVARWAADNDALVIVGHDPRTPFLRVRDGAEGLETTEDKG
jgi:glyoxylase-like metal-dependent hydrolase (beta-lactamase superfamily II)